MPVDSKHPEYHKIAKKWDLVQDIVNNDAKSHLRIVDPNDPVRSDAYKNQGYLVNYTRITREGLKGLIFRKPIEYEVPQQLDYLIADCTGNNLTIEQLVQQMAGDILDTGRYGLLVDAPREPGGKPQIKPYSAKSIINWRYDYFDNQFKLSLVVLHEQIEVVEDDIFQPEIQDQYRVLILNEEGEYVQLLYNQDKDLISSELVTDFFGNPFKEILFAFVGSEDNNADIDSIPLYDIATVNLAHYKNSCDLEESSFMCGQLIPVINTGEASQEEFNAANPNGLVIGSVEGVTVNKGGDFKIAQGSPNILPREIMEDKQDQIIRLGARLISPPGGRETAEGVKVRYAAQNSVLYTITRNINYAMVQALFWVAQMTMETPQESFFKMNDQFYEDGSDPILIMQQLTLLFDRNIVNAEEIRENLRRAGIKLDDTFTPSEPNPLEGAEDDFEG